MLRNRLKDLELHDLEDAAQLEDLKSTLQLTSGTLEKVLCPASPGKQHAASPERQHAASTGEAGAEDEAETDLLMAMKSISLDESFSNDGEGDGSLISSSYARLKRKKAGKSTSTILEEIHTETLAATTKLADTAQASGGKDGEGEG